MNRPAMILVTRLAAAALACAGAASFAADSTSGLELARQLNQAFVDVAEKVSPTVVVLDVVQKAPPPPVADDSDDSAYDSIPPGLLRKYHEELRRRPERTFGQGSGIIIRTNGYILTNRHVVEDAESITVRLKDGRTFEGTVRGVDELSDLAVVKVEAEGLPAARFGDSSRARVGEFAIAIGAPYSLDYSVTFGHISAKSRSNVLEGLDAIAMDQDFLQTDALINPGNSGGPLVNIEGDVVGINTLIRGVRTGIGFAIPSNLAREVSDQLIATGKFRRAWLGIGIRPVRGDPDLRHLLKGVDDGVVVAQVLADGPAASSDLKPLDVITAVDGTPVSTPQQLRNAVRDKAIGRPLTLDVVRKEQRLYVKVSPGEMPPPTVTLAKAPQTPESGKGAKTDPEKGPEKGAAKGAPSEKGAAGLGLTVQGLTPELASKVGSEHAQGVLVSGVELESMAARFGLKAGDIITSVDQQAVTSPKQFEEALGRADLNKGVLVNLLRGKTPRFELLKSGTAPQGE